MSNATTFENKGEGRPIHIIIVCTGTLYRGRLVGVNNLSKNVNWGDIDGEKLLKELWNDFSTQVAFREVCEPGQTVSKGAWIPSTAQGANEAPFFLKLYFHPEASVSYALRVKFEKIDPDQPGYFQAVKQISKQVLLLSSRVSASGKKVATLEEKLNDGTKVVAKVQLTGGLGAG